MKYSLILPLALAAPALVGANEPASPPLPDLAGSVGQMLFGLVVVIALLLVCLWLIKRLAVPRNAAGTVKVLGATAVGPRERVVLVEVGPRVLVLGVAPGNVRTLHVMDAADFPNNENPPEMVASGTNDFSGWLKKSLERRHNAS